MKITFEVFVMWHRIGLTAIVLNVAVAVRCSHGCFSFNFYCY